MGQLATRRGFGTALLSARLRRDPAGPRVFEPVEENQLQVPGGETPAVPMPLANPPKRGPRTAEVMRTEEKRADVNLASHLSAMPSRRHATLPS